MAEKILFGTDGWRSGIADAYTFESLRRCSQGFASYLQSLNSKNNKVVIGYDKRFLSENFAAAAAEVLAGNGFHVYLTDQATPTPVISFAVVVLGAIGAINITASHNPPTDNGFKVRDENGGAIAPDGLKEIENLIPENTEHVKTMDLQTALSQEKIEYFDPAPAYIKHLDDLIDLQPIKDAGLKILIDPMWGNGAG